MLASIHISEESVFASGNSFGQKMTVTDKTYSMDEFTDGELIELRLALRDRWTKLEAIREIYGDASNEYADASNDMLILSMVIKKVDAYLVHIGDTSVTQVEPDPEVLYSGPPNMERKVSMENRPIGIFQQKIELKS